jgi:hypothetical protein
VPGASDLALGIIASAFIYETMIRHDLGLSGYSPVQVDVKESSFPAWMTSSAGRKRLAGKLWAGGRAS